MFDTIHLGLLDNIIVKNGPAPLVSLAIFVIGSNVSVFIWAYRTKSVNLWLLITTICTLDPEFYKKLFIRGPGFLIIIFWLIAALVVGLAIQNMYPPI